MPMPMPPTVLAVHVGGPTTHMWQGRERRTALVKHPAPGPVWIHRLGLEGDHVADTRRHGGPDKAVYAFAREDLDRWSRELRRRVPDGYFGENLTTCGIEVNAALLGERWRVGEALLEVSHVRIPCRTFQDRMTSSGYDASEWIKRFMADGQPGPYLRVLEEGEVGPGDGISIEHVPDHGISVAFLFRALTTDLHLLPELLRVEGLPQTLREKANHHLRNSRVVTR